MNKNEYMDSLVKRLEKYYDIFLNVEKFHRKIQLFAKFNNRTSRYLLTQQSELYAFQNNEYIFYNNIEAIDQAYIENIKKFIDENINEILDINEEHMCSIITFVLCGDVKLDENTKKAIKKFKYYKSFLLGFNGWVNGKLIFVNPSTSEIHTNKFGKGDIKKFIVGQI